MDPLVLTRHSKCLCKPYFKDSVSYDSKHINCFRRLRLQMSLTFTNFTKAFFDSLDLVILAFRMGSFKVHV